MTRDEAYEEWKRQRASLDVGDDFAAAVIAAAVAETVADPVESANDNDRAIVEGGRWQSRLIGTTAVVAASLLGMVRVAMALFIGIEAG